MKTKAKIKTLAISLGILMLSAACSASGRADDKYEGNYVSVAGEALGVTLTGEDIDGFNFDLKDGGKAEVTIDGESHSAKWSNDDTNLTLTIDGTDVVGSIGEDTVVFDDMLGTGMKLTFAKSGSAAADPALYLPENDKFMLGKWQSYAVVDVMDEDISAEVDKAGVSLEFKADHTANVTVLDETAEGQKWSLLSDFGSFDDSSIEATWNIVDDEIEFVYTGGDNYYTFRCKKTE